MRRATGRPEARPTTQPSQRLKVTEEQWLDRCVESRREKEMARGPKPTTRIEVGSPFGLSVILPDLGNAKLNCGTTQCCPASHAWRETGAVPSERPIMQKILLSAVLTSLSLPFVAQPCRADYGGDHHSYARDHHHGFRGDIHRFRGHDFAIWRGGHWHHGFHGGRRGWWWIAGGVWYFYPAPIYPYPDPYLPPVVQAAPPPASTQYWYYCNNPPGYYPYVSACLNNWQPVPASAAPLSPPPQ